MFNSDKNKNKNNKKNRKAMYKKFGIILLMIFMLLSMSVPYLVYLM